MIDEKKLLLEISDLKKSMKSENSDYLSGYFSAFSTIEGMIAGYPKEGTLIPIEERLPEDFQDVLVLYKARIDSGTHDGEEVCGYGVGYIFSKTWNFATTKHIKSYPQEVIAWTPLPEEYKG